MKFSYDSENDLLALHKGFSKDEGFKGNFVAGSIVLDVSTKGRVRGIEIMDASSFLKKNVMARLTGARFNVIEKSNAIFVKILLKTLNSEVPAQIMVPLEIA